MSRSTTPGWLRANPGWAYESDLVLDTIEQAIWTRQREGVTDLAGLIHHHDNGYTSIAFTERPAADSPITDSASALSSSSPTAPTEASTPD